MTLQKYRSKRNLKLSPEPSAGQKSSADNHPDDNNWLIIKKDDAFANIEVNDPAGIDARAERKRAFKKVKMPDFISPMLATLIRQPFDDENWLFEIKWDGYRALAFIDHENVHLKSRTKQPWNDKFPSIIANLKKIKSKAIFDGELVVLDSQGKSHFQLMQNYQKTGKGPIHYYVFDLLYLNGEDLQQRPLIERKKMLKDLLAEYSVPLILYSDHIIGEGKAFFEEAAKSHLEGIMGKKISSTYQSRRSQDWLKMKCILSQEVVIGGFTAPRGSRKKFGALLVGVYDEKEELQFSGHVGGGFDTDLLEDVYNKLKPLVQQTSPFKTIPQTNAPATWVKPRLVCQVSFSEWTKDNIMRQPIFQGLRVDRPPKTVKQEVSQRLPTEFKPKKTNETNSREPSLTNLDKIYWPQEKITKGDLIEYYKSVAKYILPYLKNRPIVLHRYPDGIAGEDFYQKDLDFTHPEWIKTFPINHEGKTDHYLLINDMRSLLYAINLGSIDLHPFHSRLTNLDNPDYCIIDLDPHEIPFENVVETALAMHELLDEIKVKHYCKTSGGKGLHLFIPLNGKYDYEQSRQFAEIISLCIHKKLERTTSLERDPKKRPKKIYLDCLQNRKGQTIAVPYCVRPRPGALVSTPLLWEEVNKELDPKNFNLKNIPKRLKENGDLFKPVLGAGINLEAVLRRLKLY